MDKEEFLKSKAEKIANKYGITIESPVIIGEIMGELSDVYYEGFNEGYDDGWRQSFYTFL